MGAPGGGRRRLLVDVTPLRASRDYRLLFTGQLISFMGRQVTVVAIPVQVYDLTHSSFAVGMTGLVALGPLVVLSLLGGAIADAMDRRRLLLVANVLLAATSAGLALNASRGDHAALWPIYVLTALAAGFSGVELPTRSAATPALVGLELLPAAAALGQILVQVGQVVGPALAGPLIDGVGMASAYWFDTATFGAAVVATLLIRPLPPEGGGTRASVSSIKEGLAYLRGRRVLQSTFVVDINAMVFGMPRALFPALAEKVFGGGAGTVGLLYAAPGAGAFDASMASGWVVGVIRQGRALLLAVAAWGVAIALFGLTSSLVLALALLAVAGAADVVSAVFRNTILQVTVPDNLRGRLSSVHIAVVTGGPRLGDAEAGAVAAISTPRISVVSGGLACVLGVLAVHRWAPQFDAYDAREALDST
jgi:predicted MFS family arabinose efflux permease